MTLGEAVKAARKAKRFSHRELANKIRESEGPRTTHTGLVHIEAGRTLPTVGTIAAIADALDVCFYYNGEWGWEETDTRVSDLTSEQALAYLFPPEVVYAVQQTIEKLNK